MSGNITATCGAYPPAEPFIFNTVGAQNAANVVYTHVSTSGVKQFKDDYSRMQFLQGQRAKNTTCCNAGTNCK